MNAQARRALIVGIVEEQIRTANPQEVPLTLERLLATGIVRDEAIRLIACALASEMFEVMRDKRPFDPEHYADLLAALPDLPWDSGEVVDTEDHQ